VQLQETGACGASRLKGPVRPKSEPVPRSSRGLTNRFQVMLYTSLGNVGLPECLEAVHLLRALTGHDLDCGPLVDDLEVSRHDEDVDDLAAMGEADL
jgi:hypothetical protein